MTASRGDGVLLAVHDSVSSIQLLSPYSIELLAVSVHVPQPLVLCLVYLPPRFWPTKFVLSLALYLSCSLVMMFLWEISIFLMWIGLFGMEPVIIC